MTELNLYPNPAPGPVRTGISRSLMHELAEHLARFVETGDTHMIDLKSLPATPADLEDIDAALGVGELKADLLVIGKSQVWETAFAGVWRVRHFGTGDVIAADEIVITRIPDILLSHPDDARAAADKLHAAAENFDPASHKEETADV